MPGQRATSSVRLFALRGGRRSAYATTIAKVSHFPGVSRRMMNVKDVLRHLKTAVWQSPEEVEAFAQEVGALSPADLAKILAVLLDRSSYVDVSTQRRRCSAFAALVERAPSDDLFAPCVRALRSADALLRNTLVAVLPKVNKVGLHLELCKVLGEQDPEVRKAAEQVLRQVGGRSALELTVDLVGMPEFAGRIEALDTFVPKATYHAIPLLTRVIQAGKPNEQVHALKYLTDTRLMAKDMPRALDVIATMIDHPQERVACQAIAGIGGLADEELFFQLIGNRINSDNQTTTKAIIGGLRKYQSKRVFAYLEQKFRMGPNAIRQAVLDTLEEIASDEVLPLLVEAIGFRHVAIRRRAAEILAKLSREQKIETARTIIWLLRSRDVNVRRMAIEIAKEAGDTSGDLAPALLKHLRDEDWWVRERTIDALIEIMGTGLTAHLAEYLKDQSDVVRRWAIGGMRRVQDPRALGALVRTALSDTDWWVREQAVETIGTLRDTKAVPYLFEAIKRYPELTAPCIRAITALHATEAAKAVADYATDADPTVRLAVIECLTELGDPSLASRIKPLENDPDHAVRQATRELLARYDLLQSVNRSTEEVDSFLDKILLAVSRTEADDLVLASGRRPYVKRMGVVAPLSASAFSEEQVKAILYPHLTPAQKQRLDALQDVDFSYEVKSQKLRFRVNVFQQLSGLSAVFRRVKNEIPELIKLGLPPVVNSISDLKNGLVLVGGPTGSGKSTTLAAIVDHINRTSPCHIITIEDPIEVVHCAKRSLVNQREIGSHTVSFEAALKRTLRQDPDVILIGEMRDLTTISFAITAAETGHLVFGTLHTVSADSSVDRIIDAFPPKQQPQVRSILSETLRAVVCQHLLRRKDAPGRAIAVEIMLNNDAVSNMIRKGKCFQIPSVIATSREQGMQSMDSDLARLVKEGQVHLEEAYMKAIDKKAFDALVSGGPKAMNTQQPAARA